MLIYLGGGYRRSKASSVLTAATQCGAGTHEPWDRDLSWSRMLNQQSHPGAPQPWLWMLAEIQWYLVMIIVEGTKPLPGPLPITHMHMLITRTDTVCALEVSGGYIHFFLLLGFLIHRCPGWKYLESTFRFIVWLGFQKSTLKGGWGRFSYPSYTNKEPPQRSAVTRSKTHL